MRGMAAGFKENNEVDEEDLDTYDDSNEVCTPCTFTLWTDAGTSVKEETDEI
jgi:hypothetical protein